MKILQIAEKFRTIDYMLNDSTQSELTQGEHLNHDLYFITRIIAISTKQ